MKKVIMILALCLTVAGCVTIPPPTQYELLSASYGAYPQNYKAIVKEYMEDVLIDPTSVLYSRWTDAEEGWYRDFYEKRNVFGYRVCVWINGKNAYGGYTGSKLSYFLIRNGNVVATTGGFRSGTYGASDTRKLCVN